MDIAKQKLTTPEVAKLWGLSIDTVLTFIRSGELRAVNFAASGRNKRPRYKIDVADMEEFERRREVVPTPQSTPKPARRKKAKKRADDRY